MTEYAQTNLQLLEQLRARDADAPDLDLVQLGYESAMLWFSGMYRPNGKPFICHLVGTASILDKSGAPIETVVAGLLHSTYLHGDLGVRSLRRKRRIVKDRFGPDIERRIHAYGGLRWPPADWNALAAEIESRTADEKETILIRIADRLEDHLDAGVVHLPVAEAFLKDLETRGRRLAAIARALAVPALADELDRVIDELAPSAPSPQKLPRNDNRSFRLLPPSARSWIGRLKTRR